MSIEQRQELHVVRRVLRSFAPEYRLLATPQLKPGEYALDSVRKTVEIAEGTEINEAVAKLLFLMGHLSLESNSLFAPLFGKHLNNHAGKEKELIEALAELGEQADLFASQWAINVFTSFWEISENEARELIDGCCMTKEEWARYFA